VPPDDASRVVLVANYIPFQGPAGGPNFYRFGDDVTYDIHVDNVGDSLDHLIFRFKFSTTAAPANTFLYNRGQIACSPNASCPSDGATTGYTNLTRLQTYTVSMINGAGTTLFTSPPLLTPPSVVGPRSTPNYHQLANAATYTNLGGLGIRSFAGQRDDPFFVDLGRTFDLLGVNPAGGTDYLKGLNVSSLVLSIPKAVVKGPNDNVIGVWATATRNRVTQLTPGGSTVVDPAQVQVSRLGNPLVNEAVIPLSKKNTFNGSPPSMDQVPNAFQNYVLTPELAALFVALGIDTATPTSNRTDLATVFLSGIPNVNQPAALTGLTASEELRLNMAIPARHTDINADSRFGLLGDQNGFPNGRRLVDDVVDIELQAVAGVLCQPGGGLVGATTVFGTISQCRGSAVNPALGDGVNANDYPFQNLFPYLADPTPPYGPRSSS
jgi:Domain of unknown function (DUF4331)